MITKAILCLLTVQVWRAAAQGECTDLRGRLITHGLHYVPGPDTCTLCVCDNGLPKVCKAVLCSPPQDCRSFRVGSTCCEFICLDDVVKPSDGSEASMRMVAGGAALIMLLTIALVSYKLQKQKRRRPMHGDDQRSLTSIGYISGTMGYMETMEAAWKPGGVPRGEAPPPYDEVVGLCRQEAREAMFHRSYHAGDELHCSQYANLPRPLLAQLQPAGGASAEPVLHSSGATGGGGGGRLTGSLSALPERPRHVPGFYNTQTTL